MNAPKSNEMTRRLVARLMRLQPWYLFLRYPRRLTHAFFVCVGGTIAIGIMCAIAIGTNQAMVFPSLGPTIFLFFSEPTRKAATPRCTILSHWLGVLIGLGAYACGPLLFGDVSYHHRIAIAAAALGIISALMIAFDIMHPPAASTTLIIALGAMTRWNELAAVMVAVVTVTAVAIVINRLSGIAYPIWSYHPDRVDSSFLARALQTESSAVSRNRYAEIANDRISRRH